MRFKPKQVGDDFTVDDYNAIMYLLKKEEWYDYNIPFSTKPHQGNFAKYSFNDPHYLLIFGINGDYVVSTNKEKHNQIEVYMDDELIKNTKIINGKLVPYVTYDFIFEYILPKEVKTRIGTITVLGNEPPDIIPENKTQALSENKTRETINEESQLAYNHSSNKIPKILTLPSYIVPGTIIKKNFHVKLNLSPEPEIDFNNGRISSPEEILVHMDVTRVDGNYVYSYDTLKKLVEATPCNNKPHIFRLVHDDKTAYLKEEIVIRKGQNITIRGGTRHKTLLDGSYSGRLFRVEAGGKLTLENLRLENCSNTSAEHGRVTYEEGVGGAIFVGYTKRFKRKGEWGVCNVRYCDFKNCRAAQGGAIASYHARLYVNNCTFTNCHTQVGDTSGGGAIYYNNKKEVIDG